MKEDYSYFEENFLIAIRRDGRITSVPRKENEIEHFKPFTRLDYQLALSVKINWYCTALNAPNICAKDGYIIIYPVNMDEYDIRNIIFGVVFPYKPTKKQLSAFTSLYDQLEKVKVVYFEKPSIDRDLDHRQGKIRIRRFKKICGRKVRVIK